MGEETMRVDLALMGQEVTEVKKTVEKIEADQTIFCAKIETAIMGDPRDPVNKPGLAGAVRANAADIEANRGRIAQVFGIGKWFAGIIASLIGGMTLFLWKGK